MLIKVSNPIMEHNLAQFRDKNTCSYNARKNVENISYGPAGEVSNLLMKRSIDIETPLGIAEGTFINDKIELIPILRAGLAMLNPFVEFFPNAHIGLVACERHHDLSVALLYEKVSHSLENSTVIILDPMLATGNTISSIIDLAEGRNAKKIIIVSILAVQKGIQKIQGKGDYTIVTVRDNEGLDANSYVYPGVGDSGDRLYGSVEK